VLTPNNGEMATPVISDIAWASSVPGVAELVADAGSA